MKRYKHYKSSEIDWVGKIPSHWETAKPKYKLNRVTRPIDDNDEVVTCFRDGIVTLRKNRREDGFTNSIKEHGYQQIRPGDLVVHEMDGFAGAIGISDSKGKSTPVYTVVEPDQKVNLRYFTYLLREMSKTGKIESLARSIRERTTDFRWNMWSIMHFPFPPVEEQKLISCYLDKKTDQIDKLIEKIQLKIDLLDEKHTSLIKQCVAEDFDSNICTNYNGSEIMKKKIKYVFKISKGMMPQILSNELEKDNFPYLSMNVLRGGRPTEFTKIDNCVFASKGDIGILWDGSNAGEILKMNLDGILSSTVALLKIKDPNLNHNYAFYVLKSYENLIKFNTNGMGIPHVDANFLKNIEIKLPSIDIQKKIVNNLERELSKLMKLRSYHFNKFLLLKEYRQSLISSVVTGKVRIMENMI
jgi:type I restriction enzyme, S subunit